MFSRGVVLKSFQVEGERDLYTDYATRLRVEVRKAKTPYSRRNVSCLAWHHDGPRAKNCGRSKTLLEGDVVPDNGTH